jgi:hypothetical protein
VSDGRAAQRFEDGMLLRSKGPATAGRAAALRAAFGLGAAGGAAASAAAAASTRAAVEAGILPAGGAAMQLDDAAARRLRAQGRG